jgi:hypothetical protein
MAKKDQRIELGRGATYSNNKFTIYEYDVYPRGSVLAGQQRRKWLDEFNTLAEAKAAYPDAVESGCGYQEPSLSHLPNDGDY